MSLDKFGRSSHLEHYHNNKEQFATSITGLSFTPNGNIDVGNLKICNVRSPTDENDAVNKSYLMQLLKNFDVELIKVHQEIVRTFENKLIQLSNTINDFEKKNQQNLNNGIAETTRVFDNRLHLLGNSFKTEINDLENKFEQNFKTVEDKIRRSQHKLGNDLSQNITALREEVKSVMTTGYRI